MRYMRYIVAYREPEGSVRLLMSMLTWNTDHSLSLDRHSYICIYGMGNGTETTERRYAVYFYFTKIAGKGREKLSFVKQSDN